MHHASVRHNKTSGETKALSSCSGAFVVNGSPTKTAMVDTAGGRSQWSHVTTATVVLMVLLFLEPTLVKNSRG
jgi:MFS superfamily sulfate permease-like transporter